MNDLVLWRGGTEPYKEGQPTAQAVDFGSPNPARHFNTSSSAFAISSGTDFCIAVKVKSSTLPSAEEWITCALAGTSEDVGIKRGTGAGEFIGITGGTSLSVNLGTHSDNAWKIVVLVRRSGTLYLYAGNLYADIKQTSSGANSTASSTTIIKIGLGNSAGLYEGVVAEVLYGHNVLSERAVNALIGGADFASLARQQSINVLGHWYPNTTTADLPDRSQSKASMFRFGSNWPPTVDSNPPPANVAANVATSGGDGWQLSNDSSLEFARTDDWFYFFNSILYCKL